MTAAAVRLAAVSKSYPGVAANQDVDLVVRPATIHAIVGENGAGKSTLMRILYGMVRPDSGTIDINGRLVQFRSPRDAIGAGIGMVHQHFMLMDNLTVLENFVLGAEPTNLGMIDEAVAVQALHTMEPDLDPTALVADLGVGARQQLEIAKVLYRGARIIILDEPTAVLVPQEVDSLFANLRRLRDQGTTVIFISHKLDEVLALADEVTVLRAGRTVAAIDVRATHVSTDDLAVTMVGTTLPRRTSRSTVPGPDVLLELRSLTVADGMRTVVDHVSLAVHSREIVGIAGVEGNGQTELLEAIMGLVPATGDVILAGRNLTGLATRQRREAGIGYVPEDRQAEGLLLQAPLWENRILGYQTVAPNARGLWLTPKSTKSDTAALIERFDVRAPGINVTADALSGGNQQKLVIGRELIGASQVLLAAHPTRGVDINAQSTIWGHLREARDAGRGVLVMSADLDELLALCDRVVVMLRGRVAAEFVADGTSVADLGIAMTGSHP